MTITTKKEFTARAKELAQEKESEIKETVIEEIIALINTEIGVKLQDIKDGNCKENDNYISIEFDYEANEEKCLTAAMVEVKKELLKAGWKVGTTNNDKKNRTITIIIS